jgi:Mat/Ecp fimbriae outer membrane usher protein
LTFARLISSWVPREEKARIASAFRRGLVFALSLSLSLPASLPLHAEKAIKTSAAPKGFETLTEPQTTLVDVFFAGRPIATTLGTYTENTITIANPLEIVRKIPDAKNSESIVTGLTGELNSNTALVCPEITEKVSADARKSILGDCGRLSPKVAGIIFDESKFRLDVFVHPDFLFVKKLELARFLPPSDSDGSFLTSFSGAMSGADDSKNTYSVRNQTILGLGEGRLRLVNDYASTDHWIVDTVTGELDRNDQRFIVGAMRTRAMDTIGEFKMLGGRFTTTTDTRLDLGVGFGSQLVVFLPRDAQVDILKDGRLAATEFYQAGKTTLDTSRLPDGAYDVTLRIKEAGGVTREETRFYVKTATLPPADQPLYYLETGVLLSEDTPPYPELNKVGLIHGGTFWRLTENMGIGGDLLAGENIVVGEAKGLYLGRDMKLNLAGVVSSDLDLGATVGTTGEVWDVTYSLSLRRNWARDKTSTTAIFDPMGRSFTQARGNLNYQWGEAQWSLQALSQTNDNADDTWSWGPALTYPLFRTAEWSATMRAEATRSESETVATARFQIRFNEPRWSASVTAAATDNNSETSASNDNEGASGDGAANVAWHDLDYLPGDLTLGAGVSAVKRQRTLTGKADYTSRWGKYTFDVENNWGAAGSTRWGSNITTSVLTDGNIVAFGGRDRQDSGIVVSLDGASNKAEFNVMINGAKKGVVKVGDRMPVLLSPYQTYAVRLEPAGGDFVSFDSENRDITLYPGNIVGISWSIDSIVAVFGRIIREDGTPVAFAKVDSTGKGTFTDDLGYFQAELSKPGTFSVRPTEGQACEIVVKSLPPDQDYADLKDLVCKDVFLEAKGKSGDKDAATKVADAGKGDDEKFDWTPVISAYKQKVESGNDDKKAKGGKTVVAKKTGRNFYRKPVDSVVKKTNPEVLKPSTDDEPVVVASNTQVENTTNSPAVIKSEPESSPARQSVAADSNVIPAPALVNESPVVVASPVPDVTIEPADEKSVAQEEVVDRSGQSERGQGQPRNLLAGRSNASLEDLKPMPAWRVQLVALRRPDRLLAAWQEVSAKAGGQLENQTAYMSRADLGDRGTFFRLQTGDAPDRATAQNFCEDLRDKGLTCRVVKAESTAPDTGSSDKSFCALSGPSSWAPSCHPDLVQSVSVDQPKAGAASGLSAPRQTSASFRKASQEPDIAGPEYRVQLGSHLTAQGAIDDWHRIEGLSEGFLTGLEPEVAEVDLKRRGIWHRLQVRIPEGRIAARNLCDNLADLSVSCLVVRR